MSLNPILSYRTTHADADGEHVVEWHPVYKPSRECGDIQVLRDPPSVSNPDRDTVTLVRADGAAIRVSLYDLAERIGPDRRHAAGVFTQMASEMAARELGHALFDAVCAGDCAIPVIVLRDPEVTADE